MRIALAAGAALALLPVTGPASAIAKGCLKGALAGGLRGRRGRRASAAV